MIVPKYARVENERRFLVDPDSEWRTRVKPYSRRLRDRYLECGRLRLRRIENSDSGTVVFKLTKKYESESLAAQPIVTVTLSEREYDALIQLPGKSIEKTRYYDERDGVVFSIDVFADGLILCEAEAESVEQLDAVRFPSYALREVTHDPSFTGGSLCR